MYLRIRNFFQFLLFMGQGNSKAYLALIFVCIAWGTTYLGIRIAIEHFPPFFMAGFRQAVSGIILIILAFFNKKKMDFSWRNLLFHSCIGALMISMGNGLVTWGEQYISSGMAAIICGLMPLIAVTINLMMNRNERLNGLIICGLIVAFIGVGLIFKDNLAFIQEKTYLWGLIAVFIATGAWALGSVLSKKRFKPSNPIFNSGVQVTAGGLILLLVSALVHEDGSLQGVAAEGWWTMIYLIVIGSVLAYSAYMYMLQHLPVGIATIYAYVNPVVAVIVGFLWYEERITLWTLLAILTILGGVFVVNVGYRQQKRRAAGKQQVI